MSDICDKGSAGGAGRHSPSAGAVTKAPKLHAVAIALALAGGAVSGTATADGFQLSEKLSVTGFIDMSFLYVDDESASESTQDFGLDQFEIDLLCKFNDNFYRRDEWNHPLPKHYRQRQSVTRV
jgi:hypothetical protein